MSTTPTLTIAHARPDLAAQLADPSLATRYAPGSSRTVTWRCPDYGHTWEAKIANRANAANLNCPYCTNRRVLIGFNDLTTTHPELAAQLVDPQIATTITFGSGKKQLWQCRLDPAHQWPATPNNRTSTRSKSSGCPYCANKKVLVGGNDFATTHPELTRQLVHPALATTFTAGHNTSVEWVCHLHNKPVTWSTSPILRVKQSTGCPVCSERLVLTGVNDLATTHPDLTAGIADPQPNGRPALEIATTHSRGAHEILTWICDDNSSHTWITTIKDRVRGTGCPTCANAGTSRKEAELIEILRTLVPDTTVEHGALINGRSGKPGASPSVDALIDEHNLAVEFNGTYWHCELFNSDKNYHATKSTALTDTGHQLIHVWEDDWNARRELVIRSLAHKLHATHRVLKVLPDGTDPRVAETVYARKLIPTRIRGAQARDFLNAHHLQGEVTATYHFALCEPGTEDIRAVLSLRSPRSNARMKRGPGDWEIQRYATFGNVPGGFTRLLAHAERTLRGDGHDLRRWISFSSRDVSNGGLYQAAGFNDEAYLRPDYHYVGASTGWRRTPKESFQLKRFRNDDALIYEEGWSEREAAAANKLYRIYDSGKTRWVKNVNKS